MNETAITTRTSIDDAVAQAAQAYEIASADTTANIASALAAARAIALLRRQFTPPIVAELKELAGKSLGFFTDRDGKGGYSDAVIVECALEAGLRGLPFVGGCFGVVSGKVYVSKVGYRTLIRRMPNIANFQYSVGLPRKVAEGAVSQCSASWTQDGAAREFKAEIPVRTDQYTTVDALLGKCEKRLLARVFEQMSNRAIPEEDDAVDIGPVGPGLELSAPKFLEAPATPAATPQVVNVGPHEDPLAEPPPCCMAPIAPAAIAPADMPVAPKRKPGRPPKAPTTPAPPAPAPVAPPPAPEPPPESDPDDAAPPEPPEPAPKPLNLRGTGAVPVARPSQVPEGEVTLPMFRQMLGELGISEGEYMGHLVKKHGLPKNVDNLEQLALVRSPLWNWVRSNPQTALDQAAFSLGKAGAQ
jgi:hypothetical protein